MKKRFIFDNPVSLVDSMRVAKNEIYVPSIQDIEKAFEVASRDHQDNLWCLRDTFARSREINNLKWEDMDFPKRTNTLYTRKKRHGPPEKTP